MELIKHALIFTLLCFLVKTHARITPKVENVYNYRGVISENPVWVNEEGALYWVDISSQKIYRLEVETGHVSSIYIEHGPVSLIVRVKNHPKLLVVAVRSELYFLNWDNFVDDRSLRFITAVDSGKLNNRCNEGKVDAKGRFWFGTLGIENNRYDKALGSVYMMTENNYKSPKVKIQPVFVSSGIAWNSDNTNMFYIDSGSLEIVKYEFHLDSGKIENGKVLFNYPANNLTCVPVGMTIDTDDNLWVTCYLDGKVLKIDSRSGKLLEEYKVPAKKVTSVAWGGKNYSTLYVTTASNDIPASELAKQPEAGSVFAITGTGSRGFPANEFIFNHVDKF